MLVLATNKHDPSLNKMMNTAIDTDDKNGYYVRYAFMQHVNNSLFIDNYFSSENKGPNINVRKMTSLYGDLWQPHNKYIIDSGYNGSLVWRVKILNSIENSIDYVEVWKHQLFIDNFSHDVDTVLNDGSIWTSCQKKNLSKVIYENGFIARNVNQILMISKELSTQLYYNFVDKSKRKEHCIINTVFNPSLHL
jgi:hypothetical protein